jgi:hypothetical protein
MEVDTNPKQPECTYSLRHAQKVENNTKDINNGVKGKALHIDHKDQGMENAIKLRVLE